MLELVNVSKSYESPAGAEDVSVLSQINLEVEQGRAIAIVGPSGCGKSTLLNIMGGLDKPSTGKVLLDDEDLSSLNEKQLASVRNRRIGFVFQLHHLLPQCTVLENVLVPTLAGRGSTPDAQDRAVELLERVGLKDQLQHRPGELSGGQRQRVAVVRALINKPGLLLADEPTGSLDKATAENIAQLLVELNQSEKVSLIVVTHSQGLAGHMNEVYELTDGTLKVGANA